MPKKPDPVSRARIRLRQAIDRACIARGEAQWTNGYRTGRSGFIGRDHEDDRMYRKEQAQFGQCSRAEATVDRAMRAYAMAIRRTRKRD